jgi:hypothetical protein
VTVTDSLKHISDIAMMEQKMPKQAGQVAAAQRLPPPRDSRTHARAGVLSYPTPCGVSDVSPGGGGYRTR